MDRDKVTFRPNRPELITLDRDHSKEVDGRNGPQFMRILDGDTRILFADPDLERAISESGARKGDVVQIIKRGSNGSTAWEVGIMPDLPCSNTSTRPPAIQPQTYQTYAATQPPHQLAPPARQPLPAEIKNQRGVELIVAGETAIDAAIAITRYAASKGLALAFTTSDIRAMANSIICREGGR